MPLYKTNRDEIVTQFDMGGLEKLQLLKMDFLGLTTLTLIQDALRLIEKRHGVNIVPEDLPLDDARSRTRSSARASPAASSSSNPAACATFCGATSRAGWKT